jgi:predicted nucleic acid-binding protein
MPSRLVLLDNTVLTNFALVHRADLVLDLWGVAGATTQAVMAEYQAGVTARDFAANAWEDLTVLTLSPPERAFADTLSAALGAGERTCLSVAIHRRGILASDDGDARRAARNYGVSLTGSLGILALNTRRGVIKLAEGNK